MTPPLLLAIVSLLPVEYAIVDRVDVVHSNRHYDLQGGLLVEQVWWEIWQHRLARHDIIDWRLARPGTCQSPVPLRNRFKHCWQSIWIDGHVLRCVNASSSRRSWTQGLDPEVADRDKHADWRKARRGLAKPQTIP